MNLLLHICAPCSLHSWQALEEKGHILRLFFNPNIHPYREFKKRKEALRSLSEQEGKKMIIDEAYLDDYLRAVVHHEESGASFATGCAWKKRRAKLKRVWKGSLQPCSSALSKA